MLFHCAAASPPSGTQRVSTVQAEVQAVVALNEKAKEAVDQGNYEQVGL